MKLTFRNIHRDIAYFYLGLIIAFAFSGIFLNHRQTWHPRRYKAEIKEGSITPIHKDSVNEAFVTQFTKEQNITDNLRRFTVNGDVLRISYVNHDADIELATGKVTLVHYKVTPLLGQMTILHVDTSKWWIYYSDVFGAAMLVIAVTGMFIEKGKNSFRARGWKLAMAGIVFPLIFLFLLS
ncbi:MAG: PepSY-associated TM helix domain-containing protein [Cyclobacteriaceae bacterium]